MTKVLDWGKVASTMGFDDKRRKAHGQPTFREMVHKSLAVAKEQEEAEDIRKAQEPLLKAQLLDFMVNRKPLTVLRPIQNPTEGLNGMVEDTDEEDDGFYYNGGSHKDPSLKTANASYIEVMETIPVGTELIYKNRDKTLGQWVFKSNRGKEYAIYEKPVVMFQDSYIQNPGFYGLLYNTNLLEKIGE